MDDVSLRFELEHLAQIFHTILGLARIRRIVVVDDSYAKIEFDVDALVARVQKHRSLFIEVIPGLEDFEDSELDLIASLVRNAIREPSVLERASRLASAGISDTVDSKTMGVLRGLHGLMPVEPPIDYLELSGADWELRKNQLLDFPSDSGLLVLVDRDFGGENKGADHGLTVIANLLASNSSGVFCALLSHTVSPEGELEQWSALSKIHELERDRFVVVSKRRLAHDEQDIEGFVRLMRLAVLCGPLQLVRNRVFQHFLDSIESTRKSLNEWSVFDFDEAVFGSSRSEGVWEIDTLLRVITTFSSQIVRKAVLVDPDVRNPTIVARRASSILIPPGKQQVWSGGGEMALDYQRAELYREADYLNPNHLPIESGDVFEQTETRARFVLVAQPCDLMVRGRVKGGCGGRAYDDKYSRMVALCPVKPIPKDARAPSGSHVYGLRYWGERGAAGLVHFSDVQMTRLAVLDLCVFRDDGLATFELDGVSPDSLTDAWREHFDKLKAMFSKDYASAARLKKELNRVGSSVDKVVKATAVSRMLPCCSMPSRFRVRMIDGKGFEFGLRRVRRLEATLAADLCRAFAAHQSRTAFERPVVTDELHRHLESSSSSDVGEGEA